MKVHEAAIEYGIKISSCTVHFVDSGTDTGTILLEKTVVVSEEDTAKSLQQKVLGQEHKAIVEAIQILSDKQVFIERRKIIYACRNH